MHTEIGSIYEINPDLFTHKRAEAEAPLRLREAEKYNKKYIRYTASGREAIALALRSLEQKKPGVSKRYLLPAYMCDTVFFPFERAGWKIYFYHLDRKLEANIPELCKLIEQVRPGLIFVHPYFGVDTWKPIRPLFHEWKAQGIYIMEDVTQSYYLEDAGKEADFCVGSLRKWYAVPDGGFVAADEALPEENLIPNEKFTEARMQLLTGKWEYLHGQGNAEEKKALKEDYLRKNKEMEAWLDSHAGIGAISKESSYILSLTDEDECKNRRIENCSYLWDRLESNTQFVPVLDLQSGQGKPVDREPAHRKTDAAPLYFPIYAKNRDDLQSFLTAHDIYAPVLWPVGKENVDCLSEDERYIYEHILALPIDQRYGLEEMQRVVSILEKYEVQQAVSASEEYETQVIGIRVDANDRIATGHVMRCITIAKQLILTGCKVIFFTADEYAEKLLEQADMQYVCLHTRWDHMEEETLFLRTELQKIGCRKLLVDSYQVTEKYFHDLSDLCKLIYIDDCFEGVYPVDMVINYNAFHVRFPYAQVYAGRARLLLGTAYVPLREEFGSAANEPEVNGYLTRDCSAGGPAANELSINVHVMDIHILLSSGGGDMYNVLSGVLTEVMQDQAFQNVIFDVVVGSFNRNAEELKRQAKEYPNIQLHDHVSHMAELMRQCTAAVSAAGTMLFELSATQTPTVFFVSADNQQYDHEFFAAEERMIYAGDIRENRDKCLGEICNGLKLILKDADMRGRMKRKLHEVTDGKGARRIAEEIICL